MNINEVKVIIFVHEMHKYYEQATTFLSFDAIKYGVLYNDFEHSSRTNLNLLQVEKIAPKIKKPTTTVIQDTKGDKSVQLIIQNNTKLMNIMAYYRKQRTALSYLYVENNSYIVIMIKKPTDYPLIVIRIPIDGILNYANDENRCYEFPVHQMQLKNITCSKNTSYSMMYKGNTSDKSVDFVYTIYNKDGNPVNTLSIANVKIGSIDIINNLLQTIVSVPREICYINTFLQMSVLILKEVSDVTNVINFDCRNEQTKKYFELDNDNLSYVLEANRKSEAKELARKEESYIWNNHDKEKKIYDIKQYDTLFKSGFSKSFNQNDKVYYVFASHLGEFLFIKVTTSLTIRKDAIDEGRFSKLFDKEYQLLECYLCSLVK